MISKPYFLSADDDADDQDLIEEALRQSQLNCSLERVGDGEKLLKLLEIQHKQQKKFPDLILLDLNMPVKGGRETLSRLKEKNSPYANVPVYMLSTSSNETDVQYCLKNGASRFLVKPNSFTELKKLLFEACGDFCKAGMHL